MKRKISKPDYALLKREFAFLEQAGRLEPNQSNELLALYEPKGNTSFVRLLLAFGAILVGVGILSFIAGYWQTMTPLFRFGFIIFGLIGFYTAGFLMEKDYPKTSNSMYYIGAAIYGAGIFLIGQMFHLQHGVYADFLFWAIGILPLAYYLKDQLVALFAAAFLIIYSFSYVQAGSIGPYWLFLLIPLLFWMNEKRMGQKSALFVLNVALAAVFVANFFNFIQADDWISLILLFAGGLLLALFPAKSYRTESIWTGSVIYGITGIMLTFPFYWKPLHLDGIAPFVFAAAFVLLLIYLLKKDSLPAILIVCALIYRYYTDITYDFMPKSLFFVVGGLMLIGFGFWFEKSRRETVKKHEE